MFDRPALTAHDVLGAPGPFVWLDVRTGPTARADAAASGLRGARFVDLETELASPADPRVGGRHPLPSPARFAEVRSRLGLQPSSTIVCYDLASGGNAASRAYWMLRAVGYAHVHVLTGTQARWASLGLPWVANPADDSVEATDEAPRPYAWPTMAIDAVPAWVARPDAVLLDARAPARHRGELEPIDPVAGSIPGSENLFHAGLLDEHGEFPPPEVLRARIDAVVRGRQAAVSCGSGVTACHLALAMEHAGLPVPTLYVGSYSEWCRSERPIAKVGA